MGGCLRGFVAIVAILFIVGVVGSVLNGKTQTTSGTAAQSFPAQDPNFKLPATPMPTDGLTISKSEWTKGGFGSIAMVYITLKNTGKRAVKDVDLRCHFYGPSGTEISQTTVTIFDTIGAGKSKRSKELNLGFINEQSQKAGCEIIAADWA